MGKHRTWKAPVWSPTRQVTETAEGEGESSQFAEVKAIQLALDIAEREKWPVLYLYTDSWMVANALWGWLQQWKQSNWQCRGKPIWAATLWHWGAARHGPASNLDKTVKGGVWGYFPALQLSPDEAKTLLEVPERSPREISGTDLPSV